MEVRTTYFGTMQYLDLGVSEEEKTIFKNRKSNFRNNKLEWGMGAMGIEYLDALKGYAEDRHDDSSLRSSLDSYPSHLHRLDEIMYNSKQHYGSLSPGELEQRAESGDVGTMRMDYPKNARVTDVNLTTLFHFDGKPTTPHSEFCNSYEVISIRILNANSWDLSSNLPIQPIAFIPKRNEWDVEKWRQAVCAIFDHIVFNTICLGLCGVYVKRKDAVGNEPAEWDHITWDVIGISGDTLAEEELIGNVNKKNSSLLCLYHPSCKRDRVLYNIGVSVDLKNACPKNMHNQRNCLNAGRHVPVTSALAHLSLIGGKLSATNPIQNKLREEYSILFGNNPHFQDDATSIQNVLRDFYGKDEDVFFHLYPSPFDRSLRQAVTTYQLSNQLHNQQPSFQPTTNLYTSEEPIQNPAFKVTVGEENSIRMHPLNFYLPKELHHSRIYEYKSFQDSIFGITQLDVSSYKQNADPLAQQKIHSCGQAGKMVTTTDEIIFSSQAILLSQIMLVPYETIFVYDAMHANANTMVWGIKQMEANLSNPSELDEFFKNEFNINKDMRVGVTTDDWDIIKMEFDKIRKTVGIKSLSVSDVRSAPMSNVFRFSVTNFQSITRKCSHTSFFLHCYREIQNQFGVLYNGQGDTTTLIQSSKLIIMFSLMLEGKLEPKRFVPTMHNNLHLLWSIVQIGSLICTNNYYLERMYAMIADNINNSKNPVHTLVYRINILIRVCYLSKVNRMPFFAVIANASGLVNIPLNDYLNIDIIDVIKNDIINITKANVYDDAGFAYCELCRRNTYLDECIFEHENCAENYLKKFGTRYEGIHFGFTSSPGTLYRACRWRDGRIYTSSMPPGFITPEYLADHVSEIGYCTDGKGKTQLFLLCGFFACKVNGMPYFQALCIRLPYNYAHYLTSYHYLQLLECKSLKWVVVSLYRLHLRELSISVDNGIYCALIHSKGYGQVNNMSRCWEFLDNRKEIIDRSDVDFLNKLDESGRYNNDTLNRKGGGDGHLFFKGNYLDIYKQTVENDSNGLCYCFLKRLYLNMII